MLDLIGTSEGTDKGDGYNETLAYGAYTGGDVNLVGMTLAQIDTLQSRMLAHPRNSFNSSALGRYQIVRTTRRKIDVALRNSPSAMFDRDMQDRMACYLLGGRGIDKWLAGRLKLDTLVNNLAREWASLPNTDGRGHYGGQRASVSVAQVHAALTEVQRRHRGLDKAALPPATEQVVKNVAAEGRVSVTEVGTACTGVAGTAMAAKEAAEAVKETSATFISFGPWVLLALVIAGVAGYIVYDRRKKKSNARSAIAEIS